MTTLTKLQIGNRMELELPPTQLPIYLSSSMVETYRRCRRMFEYEWIYNRVPSKKSIHLHAGGAFARGCEQVRIARYASGLSWDDALLLGARTILSYWGDQSEVDLQGTGKSLHNMILALYSYFEWAGLDNDTLTPVIKSDGSPAVEHSFAIPLEGTRHPETGDPFLYVGRFDMLAERSSLLYIVDEKTTSRMGDTWAKQWNLRGQFIGYSWAAKQYGYPVVGAVVRGTCITKSGNLEHREAIIPIPDYLISRWYEELLHTAAEISNNFLSGHWSYALSSSCGAYGGCPYQSVCESRTPTIWLEHNYDPRSWDPVIGDHN